MKAHLDDGGKIGWGAVIMMGGHNLPVGLTRRATWAHHLRHAVVGHETAIRCQDIRDVATVDGPVALGCRTPT